MNKKAKQNVEMKSVDAKIESATNKDSSASPEMSIAAALDILGDIAKHSSKLFRIHAERLKSDDGYRVMDPRTITSTFQDFFRQAERLD